MPPLGDKRTATYQVAVIGKVLCVLPFLLLMAGTLVGGTAYGSATLLDVQEPRCEQIGRRSFLAGALTGGPGISGLLLWGVGLFDSPNLGQRVLSIGDSGWEISQMRANGTSFKRASGSSDQLDAFLEQPDSVIARKALDGIKTLTFLSSMDRYTLNEAGDLTDAEAEWVLRSIKTHIGAMKSHG